MNKLFSYSTLLCAALILISATACYRMPTDDDYCLIPSTNNPDYTREKANINPGVGY